MDMVHLHVHSQYSMQDGLCSLDDLIKQAAKFNMKAIALTDHDGLYGAIQFYKKAKKAGIKPIIGCEIRIKDNQKSKEVNSKLIEIGRRLNIPLVATNNVHYLEKDQASSQGLLNKIANLGTKERFYHPKLETDEYYFKSPSEMEKIFSRVPQALKNSVEIAEKCHLELNLGKIHLPAYPRSALLTLLPLTLKEVRKKKAKDGAQNKISEERELWNTELIASDSIPAYPFSKSFQMNLEKEILDIYITNYPLKKYDKILAHLPIMNSNQLLNHFSPKLILIKGILIQARRQFTRQKQVMAFLLLEDEAGFFEVITFPAVYQKYSNLFRKEAPLLIEGVLSKDSGDPKIIARKIMNINSHG